MTPDTDKARQEAEREIWSEIHQQSKVKVIPEIVATIGITVDYRLALTHAQKEIKELKRKVCQICHGELWVCENHPKVQWKDGDGCCGGAGMPCQCSPLRVAEVQRELADVKAKLGEAREEMEKVLNETWSAREKNRAILGILEKLK